MTVEQINEAHAKRWGDFPSQIRFDNGTPCFIGYNFLIEKNGRLFQARPVGAETAAQVGHNFDSISICLIGNFGTNNSVPIDIPSPEQIKKLQFLMELFITNNENSYATHAISILSDTKIDISIARIQPHRFFWQTECYGFSLPNDWARKLVSEHLYQFDPIKKKLLELQAQLLQLQNQLMQFKLKKGYGGVDTGCGCGRG